MFCRGRLALFLLPSRMQLCASTPVAVIASDWKEKIDAETGKPFYYNRKTKETTWDFPAAAPAVRAVKCANLIKFEKEQPQQSVAATSALCTVHKVMRGKEFLQPNKPLNNQTGGEADTFSCIDTARCKTTVCAVHGNLRLLKVLSARLDGKGWECLPSDPCKEGGGLAHDAQMVNNLITNRQMCSEHKMFRFTHSMVASNNGKAVCTNSKAAGTTWCCVPGNECKEKRTIYCSTHKKHRRSFFMTKTAAGEFVCVAPNECGV